MLLFVASVIAFSGKVPALTNCSSPCHVYQDSKVTEQANDEGKSSVGVINNHSEGVGERVCMWIIAP